MKRKFTALLVALVFVLSMLAGCSSVGNSPSSPAVPSPAPSDSKEVYTVKLSYNTPEADNCLETHYANAFIEYLDTHAPGRFQVDTYPSGQLGSFSEVYSQIADGSVETGIINISALMNIDQNLSVWQIPGSFTSNDHCNATLTDAKALESFGNIEKTMGTTILAGWSAGARHFTNNVRELKSPADIKGIVFRVMENNLYVTMVEALGAVATPMSSTELYSALQNGVVEGQENPISAIINDMTYEVQKHLTLDGHVYSIPLFVCNTKWLKSLPQDLQPTVLAASDSARKAAIDFIENLESEGVGFLQEKNMTVYTPSDSEKEAWLSAVYNGSYSYIADKIGASKVDNFMAIVNALK